MKRKIRDWFYKKFLPFETKEMYQREIEELRAKTDQYRRQIRDLEAYIDGIHFALRNQRRISIKNEVHRNDAED